jgi:hypothetical protein
VERLGTAPAHSLGLACRQDHRGERLHVRH